MHAIEMQWRAKNQGGPEYVVEPSAPPYDTEVDIVTVHRMALESLNRLVLAKDPISDCNISNGYPNPAPVGIVPKATLDATKTASTSADKDKDKSKADGIAIVAMEITPVVPAMSAHAIAMKDPVTNVDTSVMNPNTPIHIQKILTKPFIDFIDKTVSQFRDEADIIAAAMKLMNDLCPYLAMDEFKEQVMDILMDTIQAYAPGM